MLAATSQFTVARAVSETALPAAAGGEVDLRGCYTALAIAHMLRLDVACLAKRCGLPAFLRSCQANLLNEGRCDAGGPNALLTKMLGNPRRRHHMGAITCVLDHTIKIVGGLI